MIFTAGNKSDKDRSDCFVSFESLNSGGLNIEIESKVNVLYGDTIKQLALEVLSFFDLKHANLVISDKGALPFVMAARIEAAIKKSINSEKEFLLPIVTGNTKASAFDHRRLSRLFLPGNTPSLMMNAGIFRPDGIILDLEDSVHPEKKYEARFLVRNALRNHSFLGAERMVRINQVPDGLTDLDFVIPHFVNVVLIPKCESANQVALVNERILEISNNTGQANQVWLMPVIESAMGVMRALDIALAAKNIVAMVIGLEDYTADIGSQRTLEATESFFARSQVLNACKATGIQALDSVFSDVANTDALRQSALRSKAMGFDGMGCIHPRQINIIHESYAPNDQEIEQAKKITIAFREATEKGLGVVSLGSKMIDPPVVKRAQRTIQLAISLNKLDPGWNQQNKI